MKYYSIGEFSKLIGKNSQTLREWDKKDLFKPHHVAPTGYIDNTEKTGEQELVEDLIQIVTFLVVDFKAKEPIKRRK